MIEKKISITIDEQEYTVNEGQILIDVTDRLGIYIPRFCYHDKLSIAANCRMCLIEVDNT
jgi:NADH-quinone oxidoreductase subunit G